MDKRRNSSDVIPTDALFGIEGDNIFFRGLDIGRKWNGYECPMFDLMTSHIAARYISTDERAIRYDREAETFRIIVKGDDNQYLLRRRRYDNNFYFDFGGTARWVRG